MLVDGLYFGVDVLWYGDVDFGVGLFKVFVDVLFDGVKSSVLGYFGGGGVVLVEGDEEVDEIVWGGG